MAYPSLRQAKSKRQGAITTGDACLDEMIDGGIRPCTITELVGKSGSGKTQFALQITLMVQLPPEKGGLSGSACYLTTNGVLPTARLVQIAQEHQTITPDVCNLNNIHTRPTSSVSELEHILSQGIPSLIRRLSATSHPLKLIIVDAISALFRFDTKMTSRTLFERSRTLTEVALRLHHLASTCSLAVLVINEVNSMFERVHASPGLPQGHEPDRIFYSDQSRWFSRDDAVPGGRHLEAALGLVWANQLGLRIMMSRTGRRRYFSHSQEGDKQPPRTMESQEQEETKLLIRRFSIIFSSFCRTNSTDFVILRSGIHSVRQ